VKKNSSKLRVTGAGGGFGGQFHWP